LNGRSLSRQQGVALVLVIAVVAAVGTLATGLVLLTGNMLHATSSNVSQTKAFNLAEAGLQAGQAALQAAWPSTETPSPAPTVDPATFRAQFSTSDFPNPTDTSVPFIQVQFFDDNGVAGNPGMTTDTWDKTPNNLMWIVSQATTGKRSAKVMALVQRVPYTLQVATGVAIATPGALAVSGTGNQSVVGLDPPATAAAVYDGSYSANGQASMDNGITRTDGTSASTITDTIFPTQVLQNLIQAAQTAGKVYPTQAAIPTSAWGTDPRIIVVQSGGLDSKLIPNTDGGSTVWTEDHPGVLICLNGDFNDTGQKTTIYGIVYLANGMLMRGNTELHGMLVALGDATLKGTRAVVYNENVINNLNKPTTASVKLVPNTWRQLPVN
jgi:Tfp pilus assembly protein PilX